MLQQRRMKNSMTEIEELKEQARRERKMKAAAQAANQSCKYPDELKFNLQPQQTGDGTILHTNQIIRRALGEFRSFTKVLKGKETHLLLGLDSTVPGTPEVVDFEMDTLNGYFNEIFAKPGKNGSNNHVQPAIKKGFGTTKNISSPNKEFAEPKGKAGPPPHTKPVAKPKPPKLDMQKPCSDSMIKNPNNIESILKEMTQPLPPALTDIETPGKGTSKMFQFPQAAPQPMSVNNIDVKPMENGDARREKDSTVKLEPFPDVDDKRRSFKKVEPGKSRVPAVKPGNRGVKTKPGRTISTSSSSSDDSSSDCSVSSDSENEKVEKQEKPSTAKKPPSAINSPLNQNYSPSKMHKTKSPFNNNNNYILNKENNVHTGLSFRSYGADINHKTQSMNDLNGFPYGNAPPHMNLNNVVQDNTEDSSLIGNPTSLFPSPMDIGKTISPLDQENLFDDFCLEPNFFGGDDLIIPSKNDNDFDKVTTENPTNSRVKHTTTNLDDFTEPSLDDSFETNNLILNKLPIKYKKDSKQNEKKPSSVIDERNKSSSKSNETKDKSKSKSTRADSGPSVKVNVNSGSKGHTFRTKAELKSMPKQRKKSESSDKEDNKTRKSKESFRKSSSEKDTKKEKNKDRLKSRVSSRDSKDVISLDDKDSPNDKKASNVSSTPSKLPTCTTMNDITTDTVLTSKTPVSSIPQDIIPSLTGSISSIEKGIPSVIPTLKSPNDYTVKDLKAEEDKCDLFLDSKHETTGNIFDTITKTCTIGNRVSPWISPECYTPVQNILEDSSYVEPSQDHEEIKLEEIKEEETTGYESPLKFPPDMLSAVELKPSPVNKFSSSVAPPDEEGSTTVNDINFVSPRNSAVNDMNFPSQPNTAVMDINFPSQPISSVNDIAFPHDSSINNLNFSYPDNSTIFTQVTMSRNDNTFSLHGGDINFPPHASDHVINYSRTLDELDAKPPPILLDEINSEPTTILDPTQDVKPENTELLIDDDPYSVKDIENIVPVSVPISLPVSVNDPVLGNVDNLLTSDDKSINRNCFDPISTFNESNIPKLTIKIPLHSIKLKNKYKNRPNTCNDVQPKSTLFDSSLSSGLDEDQEIDVENDGSPIKRKRKVNSRSNDKTIKCDIEDSMKKDVQRKLDREFETPNKEEYEKLIISISLAKLKRAPLKGACSSDLNSKDVRSPKVRPPKICKLNTELPSDVVTTDATIEEDVVMREESPAPVVNSNTPVSLPSPSPSPKIEDMETEICHQNDVSQPELLSSSEKDSNKKRGRPRREKANTKPEVNKTDVKPPKTETTNESNHCDSSDENVCRECGTLRKDYTRDSRRIISYKNTYGNYYNEGRRRKHEADSCKIPTERAHKYIEAVLKYVQYLIGMEISGKLIEELPGKVTATQRLDEYMQITSECIQLVDYVITKYGRKENSASYDARFTLLCLRLQSILYIKLFKVKKDSAMKYSKVLSRYFKQFKAAGHAGPSPYPKPVHNRGSTGTPSPSSPSPGPSPGGSVASIGSAGSSGSTGSNDVTTNGGGPFVTIPTDVHEKAFQHLQYSKNLLHGHILWEESESLATQCQPFLIKVSRRAGQLTMQSSMLHVVDYVTAGLEISKELPP